MGHPDSRATTKAKLMLNKISLFEHFSKANGIEDMSSFLYVVLIPGLNNLSKAKRLVFIAHKVAEVCRGTRKSSK